MRGSTKSRPGMDRQEKEQTSQRTPMKPHHIKTLTTILLYAIRSQRTHKVCPICLCFITCVKDCKKQSGKITKMHNTNMFIDMLHVCHLGISVPPTMPNIPEAIFFTNSNDPSGIPGTCALPTPPHMLHKRATVITTNSLK